jgi:sugar lactone lactonase YvrE
VAKLETLLAGLVFGEGPRWRGDRLWLSDMHAHTVLTVDLAGQLLRREADGRLVTHADLSGFTSHPCNDMVVDGRGRAFVGNFGFDFEHGEKPRTTCLVRVDPDGRASVAADEMRFPNGSVITPDGRTLVVGESFGSCLTAFTIAADGALSGRREWAKLAGATPDGICLDAENAIWVASPVSSEVLRVREGGAVAERIPTGRPAIACMLGGRTAARSSSSLPRPSRPRSASRTATRASR